MADILAELTEKTVSKMRTLGITSLRPPVIRALLDIAYFASMRTEESHFVRGCLTFADPKSPETDPPLTRRADYPSFAPFRRRKRLTVEALAKLSRAIDQWSGALAVFGTKPTDLFVWGVIDQRVHENIWVHREGPGGFTNPGILTISMEGAGALSVTHEGLFLCALRQDKIVTRESEALTSDLIAERILPSFANAASQIGLLLTERDVNGIYWSLFYEWSNTIARICIGLRKSGSGGSLLISPSPIMSLLEMGYPFPYRRLSDSLILKVLDEGYLKMVKEELFHACRRKTVPSKLVRDLGNAEADAEDRSDELTGAVKIVTSTAAADGVVLLDPTLLVHGFGVKIRAERVASRVYDADGFIRNGTGANRIDVSSLGTRHGSMFRYCRTDRKAVGIVVSQDGHVRVIASKGRSLLLWPNVKLLEYSNSLSAHKREESRIRSFRKRHLKEQSFGYTDMPKSVAALLAYRKG